jgi:hypothetical protein
MRRTAILFIPTALTLTAPVALAARLDVLPSATSIRPGDALSITVTGDSEGAVAGLIRVLLEYDGLIEPSNAPGPFVLNTEPPPLGAEWTIFPQHGRCDATPVGSCIAAEAGSQLIPSGGPPLVLLPSTLSVFAFDTSAALPGSTLTFQAVPDGVGFFGGGAQSDIVSVRVIPEPVPAALLGLALIAIALLRRGVRGRRPHSSPSAAKRF